MAKYNVCKVWIATNRVAILTMTNPTQSLRSPPRHCEVLAEAIHNTESRL
ncbi:hypothetical protein [Helicobacter sp.]|nr:hypothetical protein [Helicobacter sp.]MCI5633741.1 hypothetical protein [Helicobacter sp.]